MPRLGSLGSGGAKGYGFTLTTGPSRPVIQSAPVVSGTASVGSTLTTTNGVWANTPTSYSYQWYYAGSNPLGTAQTQVVPSAAVGWYIWCVVTATNAGGSASYSSQYYGPCVANAPSAPIMGTATATGSTTATVTFSAPSSDGGATISEYKLYRSTGTYLQSLYQSSGGTFNVTGLTASTSYAFYITCVNSAGISPASTNSNTITTAAPAAVLYVDGVAFNSSGYIYASGSVKTLTVSASKTITVSMWGAAGGNGAYSAAYGGSGAGGYTKGTITLSPNTNYYLYIGTGGQGALGYGNGGLGGWPNGGYGTMGDASGGGGGGMTMLSTDTFSTSMSGYWLIAGGGGGSTGYAGNAGAGGGSSGQNGAFNIATAGTQVSGGTYNGSKLTGGNATGSRTSGDDDGGGGGGGFYGGGGGTSDAYPGAGGSGFVNTQYVTNGVTTTGTGKTAPNPDGLLPSGYASGKQDIQLQAQTGYNGIVYIAL